jgi:hypothetical protein
MTSLWGDIPAKRRGLLLPGQNANDKEKNAKGRTFYLIPMVSRLSFCILHFAFYTLD